MKSTYDNNELFDIERTLVETIARSMDALNVDGTRKNISEYFNSTLLPEVIEEMSVIQRCTIASYCYGQLENMNNLKS